MLLYLVSCAFAIVASTRRSQAQSGVVATSAVGCTGAACAKEQSIKVTYLGVAGFVIEARGSVLLTGPFFSHFPAADILPSKAQFLVDRRKAPTIRSQTAVIDRWLPKDAARRATMILVGHGHYDHLMDVPYIARTYAKNAYIYGGPSIANMFYSDSNLKRRTVVIDSADAGMGDRPGRPYESTDEVFRIRAIRADHAPTVGFGRLGAIRFAHGTVPHATTRLPKTAEEWKEGEPLTYVIDVLSDSGTVIFRVYYQDTANSAPLGVPPDSMAPFDLAILAVANAQHVRPCAPDALVRTLRPTVVIGAHWENFFAPYSTDARASTAAHVKDFKKRVKANAPEAGWMMPAPQQTLVFAANPRR